MIKAEIEKLKAKKERAEKSIDRLKSALLAYMNVVGKDRERAGVFNISIRESEAVNITDESKLPPEYITTKTTTAPDKKAIKAAIKDGKEVAGAEIIKNRNVQIK